MSEFRPQILRFLATIILVVWVGSTHALLPLLHTCDPFHPVGQPTVGSVAADAESHGGGHDHETRDCQACRLSSQAGVRSKPAVLEIRIVLVDRIAASRESRSIGVSPAAAFPRGPPA